MVLDLEIDQLELELLLEQLELELWAGVQTKVQAAVLEVQLVVIVETISVISMPCSFFLQC